MNRRWEQGVDHDPRSRVIFQLLAEADVDDTFDWRQGGDGDNGETLMFQLDILFEKSEAAKAAINVSEGAKS